VTDIFISYAREDRAFAENLAHALEARGWSVWWDRVLLPGKSFDREIEDALDHSRCVVVIWSDNSVGKNWVSAEAAEGLHRGTLVPARIGDVRIPLEFRRLQTANLTDWSPGSPSMELDAMMKAVSAHVEQPAAHPAATSSAAVREIRGAANADQWQAIVRDKQRYRRVLSLRLAHSTHLIDCEYSGVIGFIAFVLSVDGAPVVRKKLGLAIKPVTVEFAVPDGDRSCASTIETETLLWPEAKMSRCKLTVSGRVLYDD